MTKKKEENMTHYLQLSGKYIHVSTISAKENQIINI